MPLFHWQALTAAGEATEAVEAGESEVALIEALRRRGLRVTRVRRELPVTPDMEVTRAPAVAPAVLRLLQELTALRGLGFSVPGALDVLAADPSREAGGLTGELMLVRQAVEAGQPLGEALARVPQRFDDLSCRVLAAGEARGDLDGALRGLVRHLEQAARPEPLAAALRELGWTSLAGVAALVLALTVLTPIAGGLLARLAVPPSAPGAALLGLSAGPLLRGCAVAAALLGLGGLAALRSSRLRGRLDALLLRVPGLGPALRLHGALRLTRLLGLLLAVELPLLTALELAAPRLGNRALASALLRARAELAQGVDLARALAEHGLLAPLGVAVLRGADLGAALPALAGRCEAEAGALARRVRAWARRLRTLVAVLLLGGALALLWPLQR